MSASRRTIAPSLRRSARRESGERGWALDVCKTGGVFERFTERARQVVVLAQDEARTLKHNYIGTEHILLGLLREEEGLAARVLDTLDITVEEVRAQVARIVGQGDEVTTGQIPFTPRAKKVLELALREALSLGHNYIGTEHILLGLVRENEGVAARILLDFDADAEKIRNEIIRMLSGPGRAPSDRRAARRSKPPVSGWYQGPAHLVVACPACATPIETVTTDQPNTRFHVSAEGERTCPGCGKAWAISYSVSWDERPGARSDS
jgi:ATP-dependent Clp protease ATP-binding subunit ClpA